MTGFNQNSREMPLFLFQNDFIGPVVQFLRLVSGLESVLKRLSSFLVYEETYV